MLDVFTSILLHTKIFVNQYFSKKYLNNNKKRYTISIRQSHADIISAIAPEVSHDNRKLSASVALLAQQLQEIEAICSSSKYPNINTAVVVKILPTIISWYLEYREALERELDSFTLSQLQDICQDNPDYYKGWTGYRNKEDLIEFMRSRETFLKMGGKYIL